MATALTFGSLTICNPNNGYDSYGLVNRSLPTVDAIEINFPGTKGREMRLIQEAGTSQTSKTLTFQGYIFATTESTLLTLLGVIENYQTQKSLVTSILQYAQPNVGTLETESNMQMDFRPGLMRFNGNGVADWNIDFTATFMQWDN